MIDVVIITLLLVGVIYFVVETVKQLGDDE